MLKLDFSLFDQTPHLELVRTWDGVCLNSVGRTKIMLCVFLNSRTSPILLVFVSNKFHIGVFFKILYLELTSQKATKHIHFSQFTTTIGVETIRLNCKN